MAKSARGSSLGVILSVFALDPSSADAWVATLNRPPAVLSCAIEGWSVDRDPGGLRVRQGPSASTRVIGHLPAFLADEDGDYGPGFRIVGARAGWLLIRDASDAWRPPDLPLRPVHAGSGWVHGSMVRVAVQSSVGRAAPSSSAAVVVDAGEWLSERGAVTAVTSCRGKWAKVRYALATPPARGPRIGEAWFTGICGDQRTTCDGAGADAGR